MLYRVQESMIRGEQRQDIVVSLPGDLYRHAEQAARGEWSKEDLFAGRKCSASRKRKSSPESQQLLGESGGSRPELKKGRRHNSKEAVLRAPGQRLGKQGSKRPYNINN
eukprot:11206172-Lingulodinium_polyedra.AAC.1